MLHKGYKYRIYPNAEQREEFAKHFGCARFIYNWGLARKQEYYKENNKTLPGRQLQNELVKMKKQEDMSWLKEVNSQTLLAALKNLDKAFQNFFKKRAGFPKFKKRYDSIHKYQCPQHVTVDFDESVINLPKIKGVKAKFHRTFVGSIKTCTITKTASDKYYISIIVETDDVLPTPTTVEPEYTLGMDLGIKSLLITSEGEYIDNHKFLDKNLKRIKKLQRKLSKKQAKSSNRTKAKKKLARLHHKVVNQRLDMLHQTTAQLVFKNHATTYAIEDLNIAGMMKNHCLAKAIGDCSWSKLISILEYKAAWSGKNVVTIDRWSPSSKTCSFCGEVKADLSLSEREYNCSNCKRDIDRDLNAAINIKNFALAKLGLG